MEVERADVRRVVVCCGGILFFRGFWGGGVFLF